MIRQILIAGLLAGLVASHWYAHEQGKDSEASRWQRATQKAISAAIEVERTRQRGINDALTKQADAVAAINADLAADIDRLRNRPSRVRTVIGPGASCACASGRELCTDSQIIIRAEFARADTIRAALIACYEYADSLQVNHPEQ